MNKFFLYILTFFSLSMERGNAQNKAPLKWQTLPPIPDHIGFAGSFAGISNDALIVAGGANFPDGGAPWSGSVKVWTDKVFILDRMNGQWKTGFKLPQALGYGAAVNWNNHLILIGGSNEKGHHTGVLKLIYEKGNVRFEKLPDLPYPIANTAAVLSGDVIYVAGGTQTPDAPVTEKNFWSLDLSAPNPVWKELPTWPGPSRMLNIMGSSGNDVFLFSGAELVDGQRKYLKDAYRYDKKQGWKKISDLPSSVVAAPGPAYTLKKSKLLIFGGDDGGHASATPLKEKHPGFSKQILSYDLLKNTWDSSGEIYTDIKKDAESNPNRSIWAPVTTSLTLWNGNIVIPGGEVRPATRTPNVLMAVPVE